MKASEFDLFTPGGKGKGAGAKKKGGKKGTKRAAKKKAGKSNPKRKGKKKKKG